MTTTYNEKILTLVLREFLEDGQIPTADELTEAYEAYTVLHSDMSKPFALDEDHSVDENSDSSAAAYNAFFSRVKSDLEAVYQETWDRMADSMESFDNWRVKMERLKKRLLDLESRIDALLMLRADTAGYFAFVEDNFVDLSKVNQDETTARVDVVNHAVTINDVLEETSVVNLNAIDLGKATFTILTREHLLASREAPGSEVRHAVQDADHSWQHRVRSFEGNVSTSGEFKLELGTSSVEISRIEIGIHASNTNTSMIIVGMYSTDNYNWYNLPTDNYVQSVDDRALFIFPKTQMQWVKFIMTKIGADDVDVDEYVYEFGMSSLKLYTTAGYDITNGNILQSQESSAYDEDDNRIGFNKVTLQACQEIPDETSIQYWVTAKSATEETTELRIDPYNVTDPVAPTILELGKLVDTEVLNLMIAPKTLTASKNFFGAYKDLLESDRLALVGPGIAPGSPPTYGFGGYTAPTTLLTIASTTTANIIEDQMIFYRNVGQHQGTELLVDRYVRSMPRGWKYTDETETYIRTVIVVNNPSGLDVNLGNQPATLNGLPIGPGLDNIPCGTHTFKTLTKNTWEIDPADPYAWTDGFETSAQLEAALGTRKVNHKLLIEGVLYHDDYPVEDRQYLGVDIYCEYLARRVSPFDLLYNLAEDEYGYFAADTTVDGERVFLVRFDPVDYDASYPNEYFLLKYATGNNMFDRIILKAELSASASTGDKTPVLTAYRIKLGS
jgi:hypothetical protein